MQNKYDGWLVVPSCMRYEVSYLLDMAGIGYLLFQEDQFPSDFEYDPSILGIDLSDTSICFATAFGAYSLKKAIEKYHICKQEGEAIKSIKKIKSMM